MYSRLFRAVHATRVSPAPPQESTGSNVGGSGHQPGSIPAWSLARRVAWLRPLVSRGTRDMQGGKCASTNRLGSRALKAPGRPKVALGSPRDASHFTPEKAKTRQTLGSRQVTKEANSIPTTGATQILRGYVRTPEPRVSATRGPTSSAVRVRAESRHVARVHLAIPARSHVVISGRGTCTVAATGGTTVRRILAR